MSFRFQPVLAIAVLAGLAVLVSLGTWQLHRLEWKQDLIARVDARISAAPIEFSDAYRRWQAGEDMEYTPVRVRLAYDHTREAHVFGTWEGAAGWYIFTPAAFADEQADIINPDAVLYVNRGFAPDTLKAPEDRPAGQVGSNEPADYSVVTGLLRTPKTKPEGGGFLALENNVEQNEWYLRDPQAFARAEKVTALPVWIDSAGSENPAPWPKGGTTIVEFSNRHLEYALTWFGLALALVGVYVAFSLKRG